MKKESSRNPTHDETRAIQYALACILAWSLLPIFARKGQSTLDPYQFLFWSNLISSWVIFLGVWLRKKRSKNPILDSLTPKIIIKCTALGFLGCCFYYLCLYYGYTQAPGMLVLIVQYTWPILIVVFSAIFLRESLSRLTVLSVILGTLGVSIVFYQPQTLTLTLNTQLALVIVLLGSAGFALFSVGGKKINLDPLLSTLLFFLSGSLFSLVSNILLSDIKIPDRSSIFSLVVNGGIINGVSYVWWIKALQLGRASKIAPLVFLAPVLASIWISIFFSEPFESKNLFALSLVIVAGVLSQYRFRRAP